MRIIFLINLNNPKIMKNKKAFTLIEILVVVAIIVILATVTLLLISQATRNTRLSSAKTSLRTTLLAIAACKNGGGAVVTPSGSEPTGATAICNPTTAGLSGANWPKLSNSYTYNAASPAPVSTYNSTSCSFSVDTNGDVAPTGNAYLTCSCLSQKCE
jgi:prepilin-type N-terminal cleavage/methylation domain-containing protein